MASNVVAPAPTPILPTPTLPNGEPVPPGITPIELKKSSGWNETNHLYLYNECHLYGVYRLHLKEFLDWCCNGKQGSFTSTSNDVDIRIYGYKADSAKKFITINVRANDTFRTVKMFEPMSSNFIASLYDQAQSVYQNLVNMDQQNIASNVVCLPLSVVGPIKDELYQNKKSSALLPKFFSINIKSQEDAVYPNTVLFTIDKLISDLSQLNH